MVISMFFLADMYLAASAISQLILLPRWTALTQRSIIKELHDRKWWIPSFPSMLLLLEQDGNTDCGRKPECLWQQQRSHLSLFQPTKTFNRDYRHLEWQSNNYWKYLKVQREHSQYWMYGWNVPFKYHMLTFPMSQLRSQQ